MGGLGRPLTGWHLTSSLTIPTFLEIHISQNEKKEEMCGNIRKEETEIQHLSEAFQKLRLKNHHNRQKGHVHNSPT